MVKSATRVTLNTFQYPRVQSGRLMVEKKMNYITHKKQRYGK